MEKAAKELRKTALAQRVGSVRTRASRLVIGVKNPYGTLIVSNQPVDTASLVPLDDHNVRSKWEDQRG
ncbi:hypothetical protein [Bradyrhizobium cenepequi]